MRNSSGSSGGLTALAVTMACAIAATALLPGAAASARQLRQYPIAVSRNSNKTAPAAAALAGGPNMNANLANPQGGAIALSCSGVRVTLDSLSIRYPTYNSADLLTKLSGNMRIANSKNFSMAISSAVIYPGATVAGVDVGMAPYGVRCPSVLQHGNSDDPTNTNGVICHFELYTSIPGWSPRPLIPGQPVQRPPPVYIKPFVTLGYGGSTILCGGMPPQVFLRTQPAPDGF